ncbi:MAG: hypothetical protein WBM46_03900 [Polyangiales bacterium]|jgi:hypothetical protein
MQLPPCGLYRTTGPIGPIDEGRLVYFHNHGDPGPGIYLPKDWRHNRAEFEAKGHVIDDPGLIRFLQPLPPEGFYRVIGSFHCCEKQCRRFEEDALLQLGYNANADPILFIPELVDAMLAIPAKGWKTTLEALGNVRALRVPITKRDTLPPQ